jgi:hypothetical protein
MTTISNEATDTKVADVAVQNGGTIFVVHAQTEAGEQWIDENLPDDAMSFGGGIVVEHRYIDDIVAGMRADGLTVAPL